jgi:uncharacterized protein
MLIVPANRPGYVNGFQLQITQEVITLVIFAVFALLYFKRVFLLEIPGKLDFNTGRRIFCFKD